MVTVCVTCVRRSQWKSDSRKLKATLEPLATNFSKQAEGRWKAPDSWPSRLQTWHTLGE